MYMFRSLSLTYYILCGDMDNYIDCTLLPAHIEKLHIWSKSEDRRAPLEVCWLTVGILSANSLPTVDLQ